MTPLPGPARDTASERAAVAGLPKAELHVHLEGTASAQGMRALLAARGGAEPPGLSELFHHRDFPEFLDHFRSILDLLQDPRDYGFLAGCYLDAAPAHGIRHVEFYLSLGAALRRGHQGRPVLESVREALDRRPRGVTGAVLIDTVRQFGPDEASRALAEALRHQDLGLVAGFGMGGDELSLPCSQFRRVYERARDAGLRTTVHAGEAGGPDSVREALDELRPDRIAHGIAAADDPALLDRLAESRIPLDVCPGSNLATGAVRRLEDHPLRRIIDAGVRVTLGSDDPGLFSTDLTREYELAARIASLSTAEIAHIARTSLDAAFPLP